MRTRTFEQDDAHVICREGHVEQEVKQFVMLLSSVYADLGFPDYDVVLSLRPAQRAGKAFIKVIAKRFMSAFSSKLSKLVNRQ